MLSGLCNTFERKEKRLAVQSYEQKNKKIDFQMQAETGLGLLERIQVQFPASTLVCS